MGYRLFTDVCGDLPISYIEKHQNLSVLPMTVEIEGKEYAIAADPKDPNAIDIHVFYDKLRQGVPAKTAQINVQMFVESFEPVLQAGEDVFYIAFSSGLSGTYNSACVAMNELKEKYPERRIEVVDSLCASMGEGLIVCMAVAKMEEGMPLNELVEYVKEQRQRVHHWVTVDDLTHLRRGGRVSGAVALIGTVLGIKPILMVDADGKLPAVDKVQGRKRALKYLVDKMEAEVAKPIVEPVLLSHGDAEADAKFVAGLVKQRLGVDVMMVNHISPIVGGHSGPGTMALFFISDHPREA